MERLSQQYERCYETLKESEVFRKLLQILDEHEIRSVTKIRCLALGSPLQSKAARYQLVLLELLAKRLNSTIISVYDPVFTDIDKQFILKRGNEERKYIVEETDDKRETNEVTSIKDISTDDEGSKLVEKSKEVFYFLPHAELVLTEEIYNENSPKWVLGNDIISHTDSFTKKKLFESYPLLAHLRNLLEQKSGQGNVEQDGFQVSRRKRKGVFEEPVLDYRYENYYVENITVSRLSNEIGPWENAFSDLALHVIEERDIIDGRKKDKEES